MTEPLDVTRLLITALRDHGDQVPVANIRVSLISCARPSRGRPARVELAVNDDLVKALNGSPELAGLEAYLVVVPRRVREMVASPIVRPGGL